jgi:hypothetical protein
MVDDPKDGARRQAELAGDEANGPGFGKEEMPDESCSSSPSLLVSTRPGVAVTRADRTSDGRRARRSGRRRRSGLGLRERV